MTGCICLYDFSTLCAIQLSIIIAYESSYLAQLLFAVLLSLAVLFHYYSYYSEQVLPHAGLMPSWHPSPVQS